jgi:hypothetical protein
MRVDQAAALAIGAFGLAFIGGMVTSGSAPERAGSPAPRTVTEGAQTAAVEFGGAQGVPALSTKPKPKPTPKPVAKPKPKKVKPAPKRKVHHSHARPASGGGITPVLTALAPSPTPQPTQRVTERQTTTPRVTPTPQHVVSEPVRTPVPKPPTATFDDRSDSGDFDFGGDGGL